MFYSGNKDWKRIHEKAFSKMDSIGDYLKKKRQRTDSCNPDSTNKKAKLTDTKVCAVSNLCTVEALYYGRP